MAVKTTQRQGSWKHSRRVAWRKVADEAVILDVETAVYYSLGGPGLRIWELIGEGRSAGEIGRLLAEEYEASEDEIREDCVELAERLRKEGLLERA